MASTDGDRLDAAAVAAGALRGKVAVVTGAGGGLGAALAHVFAAAGMDVAALDLDEVTAAETAAAVAEQHDVRTLAMRVDVGDAASVEHAASGIDLALGGCDVLCANVGVQQFGAIDALTEDDWSFVLNVNVQGTVRTVRSFLPLLRAGDGFRRIVLTTSESVLAPGVRMGAYQTSKFAVMGFGETLREELAPEGIGVTILFPGGMITRHLETSAAARPAGLTATGATDDDLTVMLEHRPIGADDVVMPDHAVRNLLADLLADEPYCVTHGAHRSVYVARRDAMDAALDRMERS